jgi:hypothetical protein
LENAMPRGLALGTAARGPRILTGSAAVAFHGGHDGFLTPAAPFREPPSRTTPKYSCRRRAGASYGFAMACSRTPRYSASDPRPSGQGYVLLPLWAFGFALCVLRPVALSVAYASGSFVRFRLVRRSPALDSRLFSPCSAQGRRLHSPPPGLRKSCTHVVDADMLKCAHHRPCEWRIPRCGT